MRFMGFLRSWMLPVSMTIGAVSYLTLARMDMLVPYRDSILKGVSIVQPTLLFLMLLLTFCRIRPSDLRLRRWHFTMLLFQGFGSAMIAAILSVMPPSPWHTIGQGAVLCIICPTATAAVVVTRRLGGDMASVTTYTILINFLAALLLPALLPWMHDGGGNGFVSDLLHIASHTFPILVMPMVVTMLLRLWVPRLVDTLANLHDLPFYLWAVSLSLAIAVTTRSIVHSHQALSFTLGIALVSMLACAIQFALGHRLGQHEQDTISATQACGQKNTVFIIWVGYTFLSPITSLAGGFYSIWHNVYNSYQLYRQAKATAGNHR